MASVRVAVRKSSPGQYVISIADRGGVDEVRLISLMSQVFDRANLAARMRSGEPGYQERYNQGPLLFNEVAIDPVTREHHSALGGLQVSDGRLAAALDALRALGVEVLESDPPGR